MVLNCIDSRNAAELVFDTGIGELFCVRVAGNFVSRKILGSIEYCVGVAGAKLIVVMGHTSCGQSMRQSPMQRVVYCHLGCKNACT